MTNILEDHIYELEEKLLQPGIRKSEDEISDLLDDDFIEFGSSGKIYTKEQVIKALQNEPACKINIKKIKTIYMTPEVVSITYIAEKEDIYLSSSLRHSLWRLSSGKWKMLFHQGTKLNEECRTKNI